MQETAAELIADLERFWRKVEKGEPYACWLWTGTQTAYGYGVVRFDGRQRSAHRVSWALEHNHGDLPPRELHVHHLCGNPSCVNPDHLSLVTQAEHATLHSKAARHRHLRIHSWIAAYGRPT